MKKMYVYISSWKEHGGALGLGLYEFDRKTGALSFKKMIDTEESFNCSYINQKKNLMYVCNEVVHFQGEPTNSGRIFVYRLNPESGEAKEIYRKTTFCPNPAWVTEDDSSCYMLVAHHSSPSGVARLVEKGAEGYEPVCIYNEADVQMYELDEYGIPRRLLDNKKHVKNEQTGLCSHPHCAVISPSGNLVAVCDKGDGYLYLYKIDKAAKRLELLNRVLTDVIGASPRYSIFHPTEPLLFVNHEKAINGKLNVSVFRYDETGGLERTCVADALPDGYVIPEGIHHEQQGFCMHPSGKYLYTLMNGPNSVGVFCVDEKEGRITRIQNVAVEGVRPRGLSISPEGEFLLTGCLVSGDIAVYKIQEDGTLEKTVHKAVQRGASYMTFYIGAENGEEKTDEEEIL